MNPTCVRVLSVPGSPPRSMIFGLAWPGTNRRQSAVKSRSSAILSPARRLPDSTANILVRADNGCRMAVPTGSAVAHTLSILRDGPMKGSKKLPGPRDHNHARPGPRRPATCGQLSHPKQGPPLRQLELVENGKINSFAFYNIIFILSNKSGGREKSLAVRGDFDSSPRDHQGLRQPG